MRALCRLTWRIAAGPVSQAGALTNTCIASGLERPPRLFPSRAVSAAFRGGHEHRLTSQGGAAHSLGLDESDVDARVSPTRRFEDHVRGPIE